MFSLHGLTRLRTSDHLAARRQHLPLSQFIQKVALTSQVTDLLVTILKNDIFCQNARVFDLKLCARVSGSLPSLLSWTVNTHKFKESKIIMHGKNIKQDVL